MNKYLGVLVDCDNDGMVSVPGPGGEDGTLGGVCAEAEPDLQGICHQGLLHLNSHHVATFERVRGRL